MITFHDIFNLLSFCATSTQTIFIIPSWKHYKYLYKEDMRRTISTIYRNTKNQPDSIQPDIFVHQFFWNEHHSRLEFQQNYWNNQKIYWTETNLNFGLAIKPDFPTVINTCTFGKVVQEEWLGFASCIFNLKPWNMRLKIFYHRATFFAFYACESSFHLMIIIINIYGTLKCNVFFNKY